MVIGSVTQTITSYVNDHGIYAVFLLMMIDAVFPAASELVMVYAGALAAGAFVGSQVILFGHPVDSHFWAYIAVVLAGTLGYLVGSLIGWAIGFYGGRPLLERHGAWLHLSHENFDRAEGWFERRGDLAVFLGRVTPVVRSFISIPAGVFRSPLGRYTLLTLIGSAIWCFLFAGIGWGVGTSYQRVHDEFRWVDYAVIAAVCLAAVWFVYRRLTKKARADGSAR